MKIYIIDQHQIVIDGLTALLSRKKGFTVVGCGHSAAQATQWLKENKNEVDLIITEIVFSNENSLELIKAIKEKHSKVKILILTGENKIKKVSELFRLGINGFVEKHKHSDQIIDAIKCIQNGDAYMGEDLRNKILESICNFPNPEGEKTIKESLDSITNRELEVIQLICDGCNTKEISTRLFISFNTVETHRKHIFQKLNIKNSIGLMRFALQNDLIE